MVLHAHSYSVYLSCTSTFLKPQSTGEEIKGHYIFLGAGRVASGASGGEQWRAVAQDLLEVGS